jgi:hypothetical protein
MAVFNVLKTLASTPAWVSSSEKSSAALTVAAAWVNAAVAALAAAVED